MANVRSRTLLAFLLAAVLAVPARARPLPSSVTILTRDDFARMNFFSVSDVLDRAVGIDVERVAYRGTAARARLRGLPRAQSLVIAIDGRPLTHAYDGAVDLATIPLNMVERIEVTRGGAPVAYGPAAAGVVNIITARPERDGLVIDLETGVGRRGVRQHNGRVFNRFWLGDATYIGGSQDSGGFTFNDESELDTHFGNLTRSFVRGGYWGIEYANVEGFADTPEGTVVPLEQWDAREEKRPVNPTGRHKHEIQSARLLAASPLVAGGTFYAELTKSLRESEIVTDPEGGIRLLDQDNNSDEARLRYERGGLGFGFEASELTRHLEGGPKRTATLAGGFAQARLEAGELELRPGLRFDRHSRAGGGLTARVAGVFRPIDTTAFSVTAQRGSRFPTFDELFPAMGDAADLDPERVNDVDAGIVYESTGYRAAITGFDTRIKDVIAFDPAAGDFANAGEERARGVELETALMFGHGAWRQTRISGYFTARDARRREPGAASFAEAPLSPRRLARAQIDYLLPRKITMTNELRYESEQFELTGRAGRRLPPFAIWNLRFSANIHSAVVYLAAENLGGRRYGEAFGSTAAPAGAGLAPQPGRTFWTGVSIRFVN